MCSKFETSNGLTLLSKMLALLKEHRPQGISLMDITKEFYNMYGNRLNPNDYNFDSLYELIEELSKNCGKSLVLVEHNTNLFKCDRIFFDDEAYDRWIQLFKNNKDLQILETLVISILPNDVPLQHQYVNHSLIPSDLLPPEALDEDRITSFRVDNICVVSPNLMFVRLSHNKLEYQKLKQMLRFYDGPHNETDAYILPKELAVKNYVCAVKNPMDWENWHRAIIMKTDDEDITLYAIDFGNVITENRKELRLLKNSFCAFPPQVIRVSLNGIAPKCLDDRQYFWSEESIKCLKSLITKYKNNIECIFLYDLPHMSPNYFSVFLQSSIELDKVDVPKCFSVYLHEIIIKNGFADMIPIDFNQLGGNINKKDYLVSEAIEEPLLAIKYEPEFDDYQSPAIRPQEFAKEIKTEECNQKEKAITAQTNPIDYKRLYFTADKSPEAVLARHFAKSEDLPIIEHNYFNEDLLQNAFPCYERKFIQQKELTALKLKYLMEDNETFPPFVFKYYRPKSSETIRETAKYYSHSSVDWSRHNFISNNCRFEEHKYFRTDII